MNAGKVVVEIAANVDGLKKGTKEAESALQSFGAKALKTIGVMALAKTAFDTVTKALDAQAQQEAAINKLNIALANQGNYSAAASKRMQEYASALQDATTFGDELIMSAQSSLAGFGMQEESINRTTRAAADMAAATGMDLKAAADLMGKAFAGNTAMLGRYGIIISETTPKSQKFAEALKQIEGRFGGQAAAASATYAGSLEQLKNAIGDVYETLGKFLGFVAGSGDKPFAGLIAGAKALQKFFGQDLIIVFSEMRAQFAEGFAWVSEQVAKALGLLGKLPDAMGGKAFRDAAQVAQDVAAGQRALATELRDAGDKAAASAGNIQKVTNNLAPFKQASEESAAAAKKLAEATLKTTREFNGLMVEIVKVNDEMPELEVSLGNLDALLEVIGPGALATQQEAVRLTDALAGLGGVGALTNTQLDKLVLRFDELAASGDLTQEQLDAMFDAYTEKSMRAVVTTSEVKDKTFDWSKSLEIAKNAMELLGVSATSTLGNIVNGFIAGKAAGQQAAAAWKSGNKMGAVAGGASALTGAYKSGSVLGGAAQGAAFGSAFGPWGAAIGGVVGGIAGLFGRGKKKKEEAAKAKAEMDDMKKSITDQFGSLKEAARQADLYGVNLKRAMDGKKPEELKKQLEELNKRMEGLRAAAAGVVQQMQGLSYESVDGGIVSTFSDPAVAQASAGLFAGTFWQVFNKQGFAAIEQMRPGYEALMQELLRQGLDPSALGMDRITQMLNLSNDPKMKALMGVSQGNAGLLSGALDAGYVDKSMVADSTTVARATLEEMKKTGMDEATAASAMREQLVALQRSYEATGQELPTDLKDALSAAGIDVLPTQLDVLKEIRDGIKTLGGSRFGAATGYGMASSPNPITGSGPYAPSVVPDMGGGLGPVVQTHAGEGLLVVPKSKMRGRAGRMPLAFHAARGSGEEYVERESGGGGGDATSPTGGGGTTTTTSPSAPTTSATEVAEKVASAVSEALNAAVQNMARPITIAPSITVNEDPEGDKETRVARRRLTVAAVADAFKQREPGLMLEARRALGL